MGEPNKIKWVGTRKASPAIADLQAITDPFYDKDSDPTADAGTNTLHIGGVASGYLTIITTVHAFNDTTNISRIDLYVDHDGTDYYIKTKSSPNVDEGLNWDCFIVLDASDDLYAKYVGCVLNDGIELHVAGYRVKVD